MTLPDIDPSDREHLYNCVEYICQTFGIEYTEDTAEHMMVFLEALQIYNERTKQYGPLWKSIGALENVHDANRKARRVKTVMLGQQLAAEKAMAVPDFPIDDALDVINYTIFAIRNIRAGRIQEQEEDWRTQPHGFQGNPHSYRGNACKLCGLNERATIHA